MPTKDKLKMKQFEENQHIDDEEYEYVTIPPDGGYGWIIALAAMLCNLVCDGTLFAFGTMKFHLQKHFECSDMLILMVGSVPCGVYLLVGPIVSGLANRYGCRPIIIIGSIGAATCMGLSTLSPNVWAMMIIYGVFGGIFFGMVYLPSVVMVSFYFDEKRAIANGIISTIQYCTVNYVLFILGLVTAGTGIGALTFGPLAHYLMGKLGWRTGMLIFAGIMLTCILFGAIMKPLKPRRIPIQRGELQFQRLVQIKSDRLTPSSAYTATSSDINSPLTSAHDNATHTKHSTTIPNVDDSDVLYVPVPSLNSRNRTLSASSRTSSNASASHRFGVLNPENAVRPLYKKDALFTGSKQQLHTSHRSLHSNPYMSSIANIPAVTNEIKKKPSAFQAFADILSAMTDFSILKNKKMLLICIGNIFSMLGYYLPIMCLVSFATEDLKVNQTHASFLLTIFGFFNTLGRFSGGPISMIPHFSALRVHNALLYTAGVLTVLAAYAYNLTTCAIYAGLCGFAIAPHMSLLPSIICDCVGLDRYTTAFGILFLFRGFTSMIGPPAAGFLKDHTKNYKSAFVVGGTMIIIAAFFHVALSCVESERLEENEEGEGEGEEIV
ncbi:unnamed protein product [Rotaria sp. Silwood2]|nr:unnamed protein product [Rotaria sp. Silwood2]CAF3872547.1 unnamed protein product [Rotaria sp. Silwood2]